MKTVTISPELKAACIEHGRKRSQYLTDELAKAEVAGDRERVEELLCDLWGDDACCYTTDPNHKRYLAHRAACLARLPQLH